MEDKQRVYIKGDSKRGKEVIKLLTDLGGRNPLNYYGEDNFGYYYIDPNGEISHICSEKSPTYHFLKEFYKEIKLPIWKPKYRDSYFYVDIDGLIVEEAWYNKQIDKSLYDFGNCFKTIKEAIVARDKIEKALNN